MWLINTDKLRLESFVDERQVKYAILSHRWADEEVTFQQFSSENPRVVRGYRKLKGFSKIEQCCRQALEDGLQYAWMDTCCIDKSSSAELTEAINSMFKYYQKAEVCYAYLSDVIKDDPASFLQSQWFTRGWTLQELIAPEHMIFFDTYWRSIATRMELALSIQAACGVPVMVTKAGWNPVRPPCIATIMSWASGRSATRIEDRAYSLMGLFDVNMPLLYGEGEKAFQRLQEEILKCTEDQTIFAWEGVTTLSPSLLASSPDQFSRDYSFPRSDELERRKPHTVTNEGISLEARMLLIRPRIYLLPLSSSPYDSVCILIKEIDADDRYARIPGRLLDSSLGDLIDQNMFWQEWQEEGFWRVQQKMVTVVRKLRQQEIRTYHIDESLAFTEMKRRPTSHFALAPYTRGWFVSYYGHTSNDYQKNLLAKYIESKWMRREAQSRPTDIESGQYSLGPVAVMTIRSHAIPYGLLGFDNDFLPVCILSTGLFADIMFRRDNIRVLFEGSRHAEFPHEYFRRARFDDKESSQTNRLEVAAIHGGTFRYISSGVLAFTRNERQSHGRISEPTPALEACILSKPVSLTTGLQQEERFDTMRHISLKLYRYDPSYSWSIELAVHKTENLYEEPRCRRCSQEVRNPVPVYDCDFDFDLDSDQTRLCVTPDNTPSASRWVDEGVTPGLLNSRTRALYHRSQLRTAMAKHYEPAIAQPSRSHAAATRFTVDRESTSYIGWRMPRKPVYGSIIKLRNHSGWP